MKLTRRDALTLGLGATAASLLPLRASAAADDAIATFTQGADIGTEGIILNAPVQMKSGRAVPISILAAGAVEILVLAPKNPTPGVATFNFGPLAADQSVTTKIRLYESQDIVAIAKLSDGRFVKAVHTIMIARSA
jgi:sulfur-oxidizing protein SoxY